MSPRSDDSAAPPAAARARTVDRALVVTFAMFAATSVLFDRAAALDWVGPDVLDPFGRALWWYGARFDPLVAENPLFLRVMSGISAFMFGPFYFVLAWGIAKRRAWIRLPAIVYAGVMLYSMLVHLVVEFACDTPPTDLPPANLAVFLGTYVAYVVAPLVLLRRMLSGWPGTGAR